MISASLLQATLQSKQMAWPHCPAIRQLQVLSLAAIQQLAPSGQHPVLELALPALRSECMRPQHMPSGKQACKDEAPALSIG